MFGRSSERQFEEILPSVWQRTLGTTSSLMMCHARFADGSRVPPHQHPHEQITYVLSGRVRVRVGEERVELVAGDVYAIDGGVEHEIEALGEAEVVDVFSPHRPEYALNDIESSPAPPRSGAR